MIILISDRATEDQVKKAAADIAGYVKFVIDLDQQIMTIGGARHIDGKKILLEQGSKQDSLWGGGLDLETGDIDHDSMINIRPHQGNTSREVLSAEIRAKMDELVHKLLK